MNTPVEKRVFALFDREYYNTSNKDVHDSGMDPLLHYVKFGWKERRRPNRWFRDSLVDQQALAGTPETPPFILFLTLLDEENFLKFKELTEKQLYIDLGHADCWDCKIMREHFNSTYYRLRYPDIPENCDALEHFCEFGWREHRKPSADFDTAYYLLANKDVLEAGLNPFVHYLTDGVKEGRKPRPVRPLDQKVLRQLVSAEEIAAKAGQNVFDLRFEDSNLLVLKVLSHMTKRGGLFLSVSHDRYNVNTGGVQKFIKDEEGYAVAEGDVYFHICPAFPMQCLAPVAIASSFLANVTINGEFLGTFTLAEISDVLGSLRKKRLKVTHCVIHSFMGWHLPTLADCLEPIEASNHFYAHDYFAICPEYRLLRNGIVSCDAPEMGSPDCRVCLNGVERANTDESVTEFFARLEPEIVYPSNAAREIFQRTRYAALPGRVVPHIAVSKREGEKPPAIRKSEETEKSTIRIAFCGAAIAHKGFHLFEEVVEHCRANAGLEFFHFGVDDCAVPGVTFVPTRLEKGRSVMADALKGKAIDIVIVPSTWRETFNFVAYEAVDGGAAVIATEGSGNVRDFVARTGVGAIVSGWEDTVSLLRSSSLPDDIRRWKLAGAALQFTPNRSIFTEESA